MAILVDTDPTAAWATALFGSTRAMMMTSASRSLLALYSELPMFSCALSASLWRGKNFRKVWKPTTASSHDPAV